MAGGSVCCITCGRCRLQGLLVPFSSWLRQVREDVIDRLVANPEAAGLQPGDVLPRSGERVSLTFRRVPRVLAALRL